MRNASLERRLVALLGLVALVASWTPHVHLDSHTELAAQEEREADDLSESTASATRSSETVAPVSKAVAQLSSDDQHHREHSSRPSVAAERCLICRATSFDETPGTSIGRQIHPPVARRRERTRQSELLEPADHLGCAPARGPPTLLV